MPLIRVHQKVLDWLKEYSYPALVDTRTYNNQRILRNLIVNQLLVDVEDHVATISDVRNLTLQLAPNRSITIVASSLTNENEETDTTYKLVIKPATAELPTEVCLTSMELMQLQDILAAARE